MAAAHKYLDDFLFRFLRGKNINICNWDVNAKKPEFVICKLKEFEFLAKKCQVALELMEAPKNRLAL